MLKQQLPSLSAKLASFRSAEVICVLFLGSKIEFAVAWALLMHALVHCFVESEISLLQRAQDSNFPGISPFHNWKWILSTLLTKDCTQKNSVYFRPDIAWISEARIHLSESNSCLYRSTYFSDKFLVQKVRLGVWLCSRFTVPKCRMANPSRPAAVSKLQSMCQCFESKMYRLLLAHDSTWSHRTLTSWKSWARFAFWILSQASPAFVYCRSSLSRILPSVSPVCWLWKAEGLVSLCLSSVSF